MGDVTWPEVALFAVIGLTLVGLGWAPLTGSPRRSWVEPPTPERLEAPRVSAWLQPASGSPVPQADPGLDDAAAKAAYLSRYGYPESAWQHLGGDAKAAWRDVARAVRVADRDEASRP